MERVSFTDSGTSATLLTSAQAFVTPLLLLETFVLTPLLSQNTLARPSWPTPLGPPAFRHWQLEAISLRSRLSEQKQMRTVYS